MNLTFKKNKRQKQDGDKETEIEINTDILKQIKSSASNLTNNTINTSKVILEKSKKPILNTVKKIIKLIIVLIILLIVGLVSFYYYDLNKDKTLIKKDEAYITQNKSAIVSLLKDYNIMSSYAEKNNLIIEVLMKNSLNDSLSKINKQKKYQDNKISKILYDSKLVKDFFNRNTHIEQSYDFASSMNSDIHRWKTYKDYKWQVIYEIEIYFFEPKKDTSIFSLGYTYKK